MYGSIDNMRCLGLTAWVDGGSVKKKKDKNKIFPQRVLFVCFLHNQLSQQPLTATEQTASVSYTDHWLDLRGKKGRCYRLVCAWPSDFSLYIFDKLMKTDTKHNINIRNKSKDFRPDSFSKDHCFY